MRGYGTRTLPPPSRALVFRSVVTIAEASTVADYDDLRALLREYGDWAFGLSEISAVAPTYAGFEDELANLPGVYSRPRGRLLIARVDAAPAGCVALKPHTGDEAELKRLYVRPHFRAMKIGRRLVTTLLDEARALDYRRVVLDSHRMMTSAHAIYRAAGFLEVDAPPGFSADLKPHVVFMQLELPTLSR